MHLSKFFRKLVVTSSIVAAPLSVWHAGYGVIRKTNQPENISVTDEPLTPEILKNMQDALDALNGPAYPTGADKIYGSRGPEFTQGWMGEISERVRHQFDILDVVSCEQGERDGLHMVLVKDKDNGKKILAVCGMEPRHIVNDLDEVFNTIYLYPPSLPGQFDDFVKAFEALEQKYGQIDLVTGHSIGGTCVQLFAAAGRTSVIAFASSGIDKNLISKAANYFGISEAQAQKNMKENCISVGSTLYSALGTQVGPTYWTDSSLDVNIMDHGTYQMDEEIHKGNLKIDENPDLGAFIPSAAILLSALSVLLLAKKKAFSTPQPESSSGPAIHLN